jgi:glycosyltransferase involved in cell wall biosynthesis
MAEIAVLIPCYNEGRTVAKVVRDFQAALPDALIYVYDNGSQDDTVQQATGAGAIVRREARQGKGNVIRRMFADIDSDVYVLVDGDDTYEAASVPLMIRTLVQNQLDMVCGQRITELRAAYRPGHRLGNFTLTGLTNAIFGRQVTDMLTGLRVFSRRFVKSFPALATGFETETELTIHALELRMPIIEIPTPYKERPEGSTSKLRTYSDGMRILTTIVLLLKEERPLQFFGLGSLLLFIIGLVFGVPVITEFWRTQLVPRLPTAVLATGFIILSFLSLTCGFILDTVSRGRKEAKRLAYLALPAVTE